MPALPLHSARARPSKGRASARGGAGARECPATLPAVIGAAGGRVPRVGEFDRLREMFEKSRGRFSGGFEVRDVEVSGVGEVLECWGRKCGLLFEERRVIEVNICACLDFVNFNGGEVSCPCEVFFDS